jgi:outer membrane cobalamin receptor
VNAANAFSQDVTPQSDHAEANGDIIVTATRDKSLLSKTLIAMTAVTGHHCERRASRTHPLSRTLPQAFPLIARAGFRSPFAGYEF